MNPSFQNLFVLLQPTEPVIPEVQKTSSVRTNDSSSSESPSETSEQIMPYSDFVYFMSKVFFNPSHAEPGYTLPVQTM